MPESNEEYEQACHWIVDCEQSWSFWMWSILLLLLCNSWSVETPIVNKYKMCSMTLSPYSDLPSTGTDVVFFVLSHPSNFNIESHPWSLADQAHDLSLLSYYWPSFSFNFESMMIKILETQDSWSELTELSQRNEETLTARTDVKTLFSFKVNSIAQAEWELSCPQTFTVPSSFHMSLILQQSQPSDGHASPSHHHFLSINQTTDGV